MICSQLSWFAAAISRDTDAPSRMFEKIQPILLAGLQHSRGRIMTSLAVKSPSFISTTVIPDGLVSKAAGFLIFHRALARMRFCRISCRITPMAAITDAIAPMKAQTHSMPESVRGVAV